MHDYTLAEIAYEAYRKRAGGRSLATGHPIPEFDALPLPIMDAWDAAARAVAEAVENKLAGGG